MSRLLRTSHSVRVHKVMKTFWIIALFCGLKLIKCSLIEFKTCQLKFNCTKNLTPADCPPGKFLDTQLTNSCCHGCRTGKGWYSTVYIRHEKIRKNFLQGRGESGCSPTRANYMCSPGLECDDDFYCILKRGLCKRILLTLLLPFIFSLMPAHDAL